MSDNRCEPPEHLRVVDGWHWVETPDGQFRFCHRWWKARGQWGWATLDARSERASRYLAPVPPPDVVRGLVDALEGWAGALDAKREFEKEHPNNSTKAWDKLFCAVEDAETTARAALAAAKEAGV